MSLVKDIMTRYVITINANDCVLEATKLMESNHIGCLVVINDNKPVGILTERDFVRKVLAKKMPFETKLSEIMSTPIITIDCDASLKEASALMTDNKIRRLAVTKEDKLIGIVVAADFVRNHAKPTVSDILMKIIDRSSAYSSDEDSGETGA